MMSEFDWEEKPELNITPLTDVMLVLIAILMLTTPTLIYEEKITLAKGSKSSKYDNSGAIEIRIDLKKNIYIKDNIYKFEAFADSFIQYANNFPKRENKILIKADKRLKYEDVMYVLRVVKSANFTKVSLVTDG